jgi:hypothetical protein
LDEYDVKLTVEQELFDRVNRLEGDYERLERKYRKLQMKYQDRAWIIKKQNRRIQQLSGRKDPYYNEPANKRLKGKRRGK